MNRDFFDDTWNSAPQSLSVSEIADELRGEDAARSPAPSILPPEEEEGVRIYRPRGKRDPEKEELHRQRLSNLWGEKPRLPEADELEQEEQELPPPAPGPGEALGRRVRDGLQQISGFFAGLNSSRLARRERPSPAPAPEPQPEPVPAEELPSFDELLWGRRSRPVRITEEEEEAKPAPEPEAKPAPEPEEENYSVREILSDYWAEADTPEASVTVEVLSRRERSIREAQAEKARREAQREAQIGALKERLSRAVRRPSPAEPAEPEPAFAPGAAPVILEPERPVPPPPPPQPEPEPEPAAPRIEPSNLSVDEILADFWASYQEKPVETVQPAPRSRREAARMREEREPVPPTEAASSAAENKNHTQPPLNRNKREPVPAPAEGAEAPAVSLRRSRPRRKAPFPPPQADAETPPSMPPAEAVPTPPEKAAPPSARKETKNEGFALDHLSVDEILAEYNQIQASLSSAVTAAAPAAAAEARDGSVSRMEREALSFIGQMKSENYASLREEEAYNRPRREGSAPEPADGAGGNEKLRRLFAQLPPETSEQASPPPKPQPEDPFDPRFNLSGQRKSTMVFGDKELDLSADEDYVPPKAAKNVGYHWVAGEEELPARPVEKRGLLSRRKKVEPEPEPEAEEENVAVEGYDDRKRPEYAPDRDYVAEEDGDELNAFPSFGQYLSGLASGVLVRFFGARSRPGDSAATMEDETEDPGPEVKPAAASKYYGSFILSLRMRLRIGLVLLAVMAWIALGLPVTGALRSVQVASGMALAIQLVILLLGLDIVTGAAVNLARGRFGADSLAVLCCVFTSFDALAVCLGVLGTPHMPLCLVSSASFLAVLGSSLVSARAMRKALRVPAIGKRCYGVTAETEVKGLGLTLLKSLRPPVGFVRRTEEAAPDEFLFTRLAPLLALLAVPLTLIVAVAKHAYGESLYIFTALLCPAVPLTALLSFALPYLFGSLRIFHSGAAIAGWSGICDVGRSENLIVTDRDLFPEGSVEIDTVRIFAEMQPETIISYAGTMVCASGSDLAPCFAELMEKNGCPMRRVEGFEYLTGGGMKGVIDGSIVLCGGADLMRLMNVRIPYRLVGKTTLLLSVDGILCGIFNIKYEGQPQVRKALVGLIRSNRHPIFAIRDFLVTPEMLAGCFDVATDGYDFPPYTDRFAISEAKPAAESKLAAVVCREGLGPLVHMADTGRSMYIAVRLNLLLTVLTAVIGVLWAFIRLLGVGTLGSGALLLFLLLWALPVAAVSVFLRF